MRNSHKLIIAFFFIFISFFSYAQNYYEEVLRENTIIASDRFLTSDQKLLKIYENLDNSRNKLNNYEYSNLIEKFEPELLAKPQSAQAAVKQYFLFADAFVIGWENTSETRSYWPFKTANAEQIMLRMQDVLNWNACAIGCKKLKDYPFARIINSLLIYQHLLMAQRYTETEAIIKSMFHDIEITQPKELFNLFGTEHDVNNPEEIIFLYRYLIHIAQYNFYIQTNSSDKAINVKKYLDDNFNKIITDITNNPDIGIEGLLMVRPSYEIDIQLGNHKQVIKKITFLLENFPKTDSEVDIRLMMIKSSLMKDLSKSYGKLKFYELSQHYADKAVAIDDKTGFFDAGQYGRLINIYENRRDFKKASLLIEKKRRYCQSYLESKYADKIISYNICIADVEKDLRQINRLAQAKNEKEYKDAQSLNWLESANQYEIAFLSGQYDMAGVKKDSFADIYRNLEHYSYLFWTFNEVNDQVRSSFYAKKYINTLQIIRRQLVADHSKTMEAFTDDQEDSIKIIARIFFEIGDIKSAWACLNIIKENQFLDFVRRRGINNDFLSTISISDEEKDYEIKITTLSKEIAAINFQLNNSKGSDYEIYKNALESKLIEISGLVKTFNDKRLTKINNYDNNHVVENTNLPLNKNEALIQYAVLKEKVTAYLYLNNNQFAFDSTILKQDLAKKILEVHQQSANPLKKLSNTDINDLSKILFNPKLVSILIQENITNLKIKTDSLLNLLPFSALNIDDVSILDKFSIEKIGLGVRKTNEKVVSRLDAFGATKGNAEFSKLPGVKKEIEAIIKISSKKDISRKSFIDQDFNKNNFYKSYSVASDILHLSTHFRISGNVADSSSMLMGDGTTVSINDLWEDLPAARKNLIILSACNTADIVSVNGGKSAEGLTNIFQAKGANSVLSSLWEIDDDSTSAFMTLYYSLFLNNDISETEALRLTQKIFSDGNIKSLNKKLSNDEYVSAALRKISNFTDPYYWAAFQLSVSN